MNNDYLVVYPNLKRAVYWCRLLINYLVRCEIPCRVLYKSGAPTSIDILGSQVMIRFTSERKFYEVSTGFRGWVVDEKQVEDWLEAAEGEI